MIVDEMLLLNEQAKQTRDIFLARETTAIKNIRSFSRKKFTASNVKFLQSLDFVVRNIWDDILNIRNEPIFDDRIVKFEFHIYNPYGNTMFGHSDEISISIQQQDLHYHVKAFFMLKVDWLQRKKMYKIELGCNCVAFMLDKIWYELNGYEDRP